VSAALGEVDGANRRARAEQSLEVRHLVGDVGLKAQYSSDGCVAIPT
jgi:hypothetical protein